MRKNDDRDPISRLNGISLLGFEGIKIGDALVLPVEWINIKGISNVCKNVVKLLAQLFFTNYETLFKGEPNTLLFFASTYKRIDHIKYFSNFESLFNNDVVIRPCRHKFHLSNLKYFSYVLKWNKKLKNDICDFEERLYYLNFLLESFVLINDIKKVLAQIKFFVSYCDYQPVDSCLVQFLNINGVTTITLQHGNFSSKNSIWIKHSFSKYFFAINEYTIDEAKKAGCSVEKMIKVGYLQCIGATANKLNEPFDREFKYIGLFLDGETLRTSNVSMLEHIKEYCLLNDKILLIRLHPTNRYDGYVRFVDSKMVVIDCDLNAFIDKIDVAIIHNSVVLYDCMIKNKRVLIYNICNDSSYSDKKFLSIQVNNVMDINEILSNDKYTDHYYEIKDYLIGDFNVKQSYIKTMKNLGIKL